MKLFVTMITPKIGGAGDYLDIILGQYDGYIKIHPINIGIKNIYLRKIISELQIILIKFSINIIAFFKIKSLVLYHPQTVSYKLSNRLIKNSKKTFYYILDASIFCIKSYNHREGKECEKCISNIDPFPDCNFFPRKNIYNEYKNHHKVIKNKLNNIEFITQTVGYNKILEKIFGPKVNFRIEKMRFSQLKNIIPYEKDRLYDFVFHGNFLPAKGSKYVISLSKQMKNKIFFIPSRGQNNNNLIFQDVNWTNGLLEAIMYSKIVLCPSFWSAPLEGSIIKTMLLKRPVAIYINNYSASNTLIPKNCFIPLNGDITNDVKTLFEYLDNTSLLNNLIISAYNWAKNYINE